MPQARRVATRCLSRNDSSIEGSGLGRGRAKPPIALLAYCVVGGGCLVCLRESSSAALGRGNVPSWCVSRYLGVKGPSYKWRAFPRSTTAVDAQSVAKGARKLTQSDATDGKQAAGWMGRRCKRFPPFPSPESGALHSCHLRIRSCCLVNSLIAARCFERWKG